MSKERSSAWAGKGWLFLSAMVAVAIVTGCMFFARSQGADREGDDAKVSSPLVVQQGQSIAASGEGRLFAGPLHTCMLLGNGSLKCWGDNSVTVPEWTPPTATPFARVSRRAREAS